MNGEFAGPFHAAELLYQTEEYDGAARRLVEIARVGSAGAKVRALSRLVVAECDAGRTEAGFSAFKHAREIAGRSNVVDDHAYAELLVAEARCALAFDRPQILEPLADRVELLALQAEHDAGLWSLAARSRFYLSYSQYVRYDISAASESCARALAALSHDSDPKPFVRVPLLALCAQLRTHSLEGAHLATPEILQAYELATEHGMVATARGLLYNALIIPLISDEFRTAAEQTPLTQALAQSAEQLALLVNDVRLQAVAVTAAGRFSEGVRLFERARVEHGQDSFWNPVLTTLGARAFFLAGRFARAEGLARTAIDSWEHSGMHRQGNALRIRAESLEALGQRRAALAAVQDALGALEPYSPVYHLLATYRCAQRLSPRPAYRERVACLSEALRGKSLPVSTIDPGGAGPRTLCKGRLTPRQREVALLVAGGRTNRAIANELGISAKTVANHVATIFEQFGFRARWQLTRETIPD